MAKNKIPWQCWEAPGFKTCHAKQWEAARKLCELAADQAYGGDMNRCVAESSVVKTIEECGLLCPQPAPGTPTQLPRSEELPVGPIPQPRQTLSPQTILIGAAALTVVVVLLTRR